MGLAINRSLYENLYACFIDSGVSLDVFLDGLQKRHTKRELIGYLLDEVDNLKEEIDKDQENKTILTRAVMMLTEFCMGRLDHRNMSEEKLITFVSDLNEVMWNC
jgi:hypothetical protein